MPRDANESDLKGLDVVEAAVEHIFEGRPVRSVLRSGEPWFVAADVCRALNLKADRGAYTPHVAKLDDDEKVQVSRDLLPPRLNPRVHAEPTAAATTAPSLDAEPESPVEIGPTAWLVSESGLYTLILRSRDATTLVRSRIASADG